MENLNRPQVSDKEFVVRFFGIFICIGAFLVAMAWLRAIVKGDRADWDRVMTVVGPPVAALAMLISLVPAFVWWGLLIGFVVWLFFGILQQVVRAAVHQALQERERR